MKKIKEDKPKQKEERRNEEHKIETPSPPQVMDPSSPPHKQPGGKTENRDKQDPRAGQSGKEKQPLAPREEL